MTYLDTCDHCGHGTYRCGDCDGRIGYRCRPFCGRHRGHGGECHPGHCRPTSDQAGGAR